jgi:hypothetical protein
MIQHEKVQRDSKLIAEKLAALKTKEALFQRQKDIEKQSAQDAEDIISLTNSQLESLNIIAKAVYNLIRALAHSARKILSGSQKNYFKTLNCASHWNSNRWKNELRYIIAFML